MLFQDKLVALSFLLMVRCQAAAGLNREHPAWKNLQDAGMIVGDYSLTDKGWETVNRLANEFGDLL